MMMMMMMQAWVWCVHAWVRVHARECKRGNRTPWTHHCCTKRV